MKKKTVSLVLGSGGARGLTHVGVIKCLEESGYEISSISGCSIGALIGGFYAAGKLDDYTQWLESLSIFDMFKLLDFKGSGGLVSGNTLMQELEKMLKDCNIEDLPIKFTAVATDIDGEKEVWLNEGSLLDAIRASISLPFFFTPHPHNDRFLLDGGILNPVPIAPTFHNSTDLTIAVNLGAEDTDKVRLKESKKGEDIISKVKQYFIDAALTNPLEKNGLYSISNKSFDTMQSTIARMKLAAYPPDIEVKIPRSLCGILEFNKAHELIEYGYETCKQTLKSYKDK
jgi:NTE family protein